MSLQTTSAADGSGNGAVLLLSIGDRNKHSNTKHQFLLDDADRLPAIRISKARKSLFDFFIELLMQDVYVFSFQTCPYPQSKKPVVRGLEHFIRRNIA